MEKTVENYSVSLPVCVSPCNVDTLNSYLSFLQVVTMQPGGWTTSEENKIRILMVRDSHLDVDH